MRIEGDKAEIAVMIPEITGPVQLFSANRQVEKTVQINATTTRRIIVETYKDYYIGSRHRVELITEGNYKAMIHKYLKETPEVLERLGKRGFRYENLPFMILFHNKKLTKGSPLTKADVKNWGTI